VARAEHGVATVEFAVVAVALLLIVLGILYFGRLLNYSEDATHLANEAARLAAVNTNPCSSQNVTLQNCVLNQGDAELKNATGDVTSRSLSFCLPNGTSNFGDPVRATYTFSFKFVPLLNLVPITVTRTATMMLEQTPTAYTPSSTC
jgi:Flp pilus assembly protein TadG